MAVPAVAAIAALAISAFLVFLFSALFAAALALAAAAKSFCLTLAHLVYSGLLEHLDVLLEQNDGVAQLL